MTAETIATVAGSVLLILGALITITPDTLVIAVDRDNGSMFVHGLFVAGDGEGFRESLVDVRDRLVRGTRARALLQEPSS